jgi:hypothetical protein
MLIMSQTVNDPQISFAFAATTKCSGAGGDRAVPSPSRRMTGKPCNFLNNVGSWPEGHAGRLTLLVAK